MDSKSNLDFISVKKELFNKLYDNLNKEQREAVLTVNGPLLVLAGAGTGKTTVLVNRIAHIIRFGNAYDSEIIPDGMTLERLSELKGALGLSKEEIADVLSEFITDPCPPWAMLCITFTNKAANEMKERLASVIGQEYASQIWAGTFHSVCAKLLRKYADSLGYNSNFTIYDTDDSKRVILSCIKELNFDEKALSPKSVLGAISALKNKLKTPSMFHSEIGSDFKGNQIASIYTLYQKKLISSNALDFDDIIMQTVSLLTENDEARAYCQRKFKYVSVDEFQDTNYAQLRLVELLSGGYRNLMVVGDDDQSIYKFRGATIENILNFDKEYPDAAVIRLEQNYRSTRVILDAANAVISNNSSRHDKALRTDREGGSKIVVKKCDTQNHESKFIINKIMDMMIRERRKYGDFAVLYRTNAQAQNLEQYFVRSGVPHKVIGGQRFYERKEIKDVMSYLALINNRNDDLRLKRIINEPKRKIGEKTVSDIEYLAQLHGVSMMQVMSEASKYPQICKSAQKLTEFVGLIDELTELSSNEPLSELFEQTISRSGYRAMLLDGGEEEADRLNNVQELVSTAIEFEKQRGNEATLNAYLEDVALITDVDSLSSDGTAVTLMTIHSAKGLEFPVVFIPGFEEGIFPGNQSMISEDEIEEERRLAYVAITRAKDSLFCVHAKERLLYGKTTYNSVSRFVQEIPEECVDGSEEEASVRTDGHNSVRYRKQAVSKEFFSRPAVTAAPPRTFDKFSAGDRVLHVVFGEGTVLSAKEIGTDILYEIAFDDRGTKKLMATYAKLKKA